MLLFLHGSYYYYYYYYYDQPSYYYTINGTSLQSVDKFADLGIQRTSCAGYAGHCKEMSAKACKMAGTIRRAFQYKTRDLMWPTFQNHLLPKLMYCLQALSYWQTSGKEPIEKILQRYIKNSSGMRNLLCSKMLRKLNTLTLSNRRIYADMIFTYKCINGHTKFPATELECDIKASIT